MRSLDPLSISRELSEMERRVVGLRRALAQGRGFGRDPFGSERMGKTLFDELRDLPQHDPLRPELLRWVFAFAEARINLPWSVHEAELEHEAIHPVREPREGMFTLRQMTLAALTGDESSLWHAARERSAVKLGAHRAALWERRHELAARMRFASFDELEPFECVARAEARPFLKVTGDLARELTQPGFAGFVEASMARSAAQGWPARLAPDTLLPLLGHADLLRSLALDVERLPQRFAPASFARAFYAVGGAFARALAPKDQPFVIARDRGRLAESIHASLFASLVADPMYLRRMLGLSGEELERHRRALALALCSWVRLAAVRSELRIAALRGGESLHETHAELLCQLTDREPVRGVALGLFRLEVLEGARLAGWFLAAARREELINQHDEDWFRNPRAVEQLREEARLVPRSAASAEELAHGRALLEKSLLAGVSR